MTNSAESTGAPVTEPLDLTATGIVKLQTPPAAAPAFTMLGDDDAAACVDGVCAVPPPQQ